MDAAPPATATWQAGTGREKITPSDALWMTGYATRDHPAEGTSQELWVKALAFADPAGQRGVLITLDLCGITQEITARVCAQLEQKHHLPRAAVMIRHPVAGRAGWIADQANESFISVSNQRNMSS